MKVAKEQLEAVAAAANVNVIPLSDERYPPLLRTIPDPPARLYVRGDPGLLSEPQLALVGSRRASAAGLRAAGLFAGGVVAAGMHVCSGLALGIDGASHRGALTAGGRSIAVMATGIDRVYPARHRGLADELLRAGCLVTEFPPGTPPHRGNFPRRNRIISGLSLGVLVVEAALRSGSLITAGAALEQGREVFALPWSMLHSGGAGCLRLIRDGVKMVESMDDILEELGPMYAAQQELFANEGPPRKGPPGKGPPRAVLAELSATQRRLLQLVGFEVVGLDELAGLSAQPVDQLMSNLSDLELKGLISRSPGGYIRC